MISVIIPAWNEERFIGCTLAAVRAAADQLQESSEIIVVDDDSTDRTSEIARRFGARVIHVRKHQISAVRNAGARAARGSRLIFIDADTRPTRAAVNAAIKALDGGAVGGGCSFCFDDSAPRWMHGIVSIGCWIARQWG